MAPVWVVVAHVSLCDAFCLPLGGHADGVLLKRFADSAGVPVSIALAVAAVESGYQGGNHWRGGHGEIGRMQIKPRLWRWSFRRQCGTKPITDYVTNVCKGMFILRHWHGETGSWMAAVRRYNGRGADSRTYMLRVERELRALAERGVED